MFMQRRRSRAAPHSRAPALAALAVLRGARGCRRPAPAQGGLVDDRARGVRWRWLGRTCWSRGPGDTGASRSTPRRARAAPPAGLFSLPSPGRDSIAEATARPGRRARRRACGPAGLLGQSRDRRRPGGVRPRPLRRARGKSAARRAAADAPRSEVRRPAGCGGCATRWGSAACRCASACACATAAYPRATAAKSCSSPAAPGRRASCLRDVAELLRLGEALQLLQRLVLDLADALARDVERPPDLVERARVLAAEAVAQLEHAALAVGEVLQRLAQRLLGEDLRGALVRRLGPLVGDELAELGLLLVADRLLERDRRLRGALDRVDLLRDRSR